VFTFAEFVDMEEERCGMDEERWDIHVDCHYFGFESRVSRCAL
jgi:hypothetical protein